MHLPLAAQLAAQQAAEAAAQAEADRIAAAEAEARELERQARWGCQRNQHEYRFHAESSLIGAIEQEHMRRYHRQQ